MSFQQAALKISQQKNFNTVQYSKLLDQLENPVSIDSVEMLSDSSGEEVVLHEMQKEIYHITSKNRLKNFLRFYVVLLIFTFALFFFVGLALKEKITFLETRFELMVAETFCLALTTSFFLALPACCCCVKKYTHV